MDNNQTLNQSEYERLLSAISNDTPILLFPVRLETHFRYKTYKEPKDTDLIRILIGFKDLTGKIIKNNATIKANSLLRKISNFLAPFTSAAVRKNITSKFWYFFFNLLFSFKKAIDKLLKDKEPDNNLIPEMANILSEITSADMIPKNAPDVLATFCKELFQELRLLTDRKKHDYYENEILKAIQEVIPDKTTVWDIERKIEKPEPEVVPTIQHPGEYIPHNLSPEQIIQNYEPVPVPTPTPVPAPAPVDEKLAELTRLQTQAEDWIEILRDDLLKAHEYPYTQKELCVRIFPNEICLDYLTDKLTEEEILDGKKFWIQCFIASGSEKNEYEAWQVLCAKYPVHRAAWIARTLKPNELARYRKGEMWFNLRPYPAMAEMQEACRDIYRYLGELDMDSAAIGMLKKVFTLLDEKVKAHEFLVDYLYDQIWYTIRHLKKRFPMLLTEADALLENMKSKRITIEDLMDRYLADPKLLNSTYKFFPTVQVNTSGLPDMPVSKIMPDRFLFIGEANMNTKITHYGKRVKRNLQMGISLAEDPESDPYKITEKGDLEMNGGMAWMTDYDTAVEAGMAITVPLPPANLFSFNEFKYIYVLGICDTKNNEKEILENLFNSHNYTSSGIELLKAGTPTNIVAGGKPAYDSDPEEEMKYRYEIEAAELLNIPIKSIADSFVISDMLNLDYESCWRKVKNYDNTEMINAESANSILGIVFRNNVTDKTLLTYCSLLNDFLRNHVKARGVIPSFRIENQPYGIALVTDFMKLKDNLPQISSNKSINEFIQGLCNFLVDLADEWKTIRDNEVFDSEKLKSRKEPSKDFLWMAGLTPYSTTLFKRWMVESPLLPGSERKKPKIGENKKIPEIFTLLDKYGYFDPIPVDDLKKEVMVQELIEELDFNIIDNYKIEISEEEKILLVSEFFDLFTYRLDAWFTGILHYLLTANKTVKPKTPKIGAYGWVFNLKENPRELLSSTERSKIVKEMELTPNDSSDALQIYKNTGEDKGEYIVAPSLNHAITAAILRAAYKRTKRESGDSHLCVNLSSMRARQALRMIEGIQSGMSTGIILGADLERYLHEAYRNGKEYEMDKYIYPLRKLFPQTVDLEAGDERAQNYVMEVINGETLLNMFIPYWDNKGSLSDWLEKNYNSQQFATFQVFQEFAKGTGLNKNDKQRKYLFKLIERIMDSYDALNDLLLAEGVHRLVQDDRSNYAAIIGFMQSGQGNLPTPEVLNTPMENVVVAHKVAIALPQSNETPTKPMAIAEPAVNLWIQQLIGSMSNILFWIKENDKTSACSLEEIEITPIEYLYLSANDQILLSYLETRWRLKNNDFTNEITLYLSNPETETENEETTFSVYEDEVRMSRLRYLIQYGHAMAANDFETQIESDENDEQAIDVEELVLRYGNLLTHLTTLKDEMKLCRNHLDMHLKTVPTCSNEILAEMHELLCGCVEAGLFNSLPLFNTNLFLETNTEPIAWRINPVTQPLEFQQAIEKQVAFVQSFDDTIQELEKRIATAEAITKTNDENRFISAHYIEAIQTLLIKNFKVVPRFSLHDRLDEKLLDYEFVLRGGTLQYENLEENKFEEWQSEMAEVKEGMKNWHHLSLFQSMCNQGCGEASILQTNSDGELVSNKWLGSNVEEESELQDVDSLIIYNSDAFKLYMLEDEKPVKMYNSGLIIDSWMEFIPYKKHNAGMAFYCDRPDNESPQALLLAVHPKFKKGAAKWSFEDVKELLDSTRFMMMNRAVEPDHIYKHEALSRLFPLLNNIKIQKERPKKENPIY